MTETSKILLLTDPETGSLINANILAPAGYKVMLCTEWQTTENMLQSDQVDLVIASDKLEGKDTWDLITFLANRRPPIPVILVPKQHSDKLAIQALRHGCADYILSPIQPNDLLQAVSRVLEQKKRLEEWVRLESKRDTKSLQKRVDGMLAIQNIGQQVTSLLDLDNVLPAVVDAAVDLTNAEEGSLLLIDETTGELYMRAGKNFKEDFVSTFRLPTQDTLAGQVISTGKPVIIDEKKPQKIKTSYLVHTLIYVPLKVHGRVIGVLEVDNRQSSKPFSEYHVTLMSTLADYAAIAIENARLYSHSEVERNKLETILTKIEEGVIVIDHEHRMILVNRKAREAFDITEEHLTGKRVRDIIQHQELLEVIRGQNPEYPSRVEISLEDGRVLNAQLTPIPEVGLAVTMQDITYLKELDRIKSDFVNTVSHDLRSPLTAILGYVELIERMGFVDEQQREFVRRIQLSVHSITALINDLLDLGRIEAGFDARNEVVPFQAIIQYAVDGLSVRAADKSQELVIDIKEDLPPVLGNPVRLRQMLSNLISNAIKYTPDGGKIRVVARAEGSQVITQIMDNGPGIPPADQPYIFDKFYRASNIPSDTLGTGLGLAIVKSIVDNHLGRIWVDSQLGEGTAFTVVLPITDREL
jgi:two-component system phosphate regulon sensor histidine kinase PhoR